MNNFSLSEKLDHYNFFYYIQKMTGKLIIKETEK